MSQRKRHTPEFKLKAVIEVLKGEKTASQIAGELEVHPMMLSQWKSHFLEHGADIFKKTSKKKNSFHEHVDETALFEQIGRLKVENEWYKKKLGNFQ